MATAASTSGVVSEEVSVEGDRRLAEVLQLQQMQQKQEMMQLQQTHLVTNADTEFRRGLEELIQDHLQTCMAIASSSYSESHNSGTERSEGGRTEPLDGEHQPGFNGVGADEDFEEVEEDGARLVRRRRANRQGARSLAGRRNRRDSSLLGRLETWHARQAEEMMNTMERQAREAELLALAGLHAVSMLDASFLQERASPQAAPDLPRQRRGQAWSLVQRWRELEIEQAEQQRQQREGREQRVRVRARGPELALDPQDEYRPVVQRPRREVEAHRVPEGAQNNVTVARQEAGSLPSPLSAADEQTESSTHAVNVANPVQLSNSSPAAAHATSVASEADNLREQIDDVATTIQLFNARAEGNSFSAASSSNGSEVTSAAGSQEVESTRRAHRQRQSQASAQTGRNPRQRFELADVQADDRNSTGGERDSQSEVSEVSEVTVQWHGREGLAADTSEQAPDLEVSVQLQTTHDSTGSTSSESASEGDQTRSPQIAIVEEQRLRAPRGFGPSRSFNVAQQQQERRGTTVPNQTTQQGTHAARPEEANQQQVTPVMQPRDSQARTSEQLLEADRERLRQELDRLLASHAVSAFAYRQQLQSFFQQRLRGRADPLARETRSLGETEPRQQAPTVEMAAAEIGQLRERRFVSGMRDNFRSLLENIVGRTASRLTSEDQQPAISPMQRRPPPPPPPPPLEGPLPGTVPPPPPPPPPPRGMAPPTTFSAPPPSAFSPAPRQVGLPLRVGRPAGPGPAMGGRRPGADLPRPALEHGGSRLGGGRMAGTRRDWREAAGAQAQRRRQPPAENVELQELLSRRSVTTMLASEFRDRLDELIQSFIVRRSGAPLVPPQWSPRPATPQVPSQQPGREGQRQMQPGPSGLRPIPPPPPLPPRPLWHFYVPVTRPAGRQVDEDEAAAAFPNWQVRHHPPVQVAAPVAVGAAMASSSTQLRDLEERLASRITHLEAMMEQALEMMLELQRSQRQELAGALQRVYEGSGKAVPTEAIDGSKWTLVKRGTCCICCDKDIDSLLYKCGHMCTCHHCANELLVQDAKCPMCRAPIKEVVRAFTSA